MSVGVRDGVLVATIVAVGVELEDVSYMCNIQSLLSRAAMENEPPPLIWPVFVVSPVLGLCQSTSSVPLTPARSNVKLPPAGK